MTNAPNAEAFAARLDATPAHAPVVFDFPAPGDWPELRIRLLTMAEVDEARVAASTWLEGMRVPEELHDHFGVAQVRLEACGREMLARALVLEDGTPAFESAEEMASRLSAAECAVCFDAYTYVVEMARPTPPLVEGDAAVSELARAVASDVVDPEDLTLRAKAEVSHALAKRCTELANIINNPDAECPQHLLVTLEEGE